MCQRDKFRKGDKIAMDPVTNPYAPGAGTQPPELAGRDDILNRTRTTLARVQSGRAAKSFILVGLRGVGKTVLLNKVETIAEESNYIAAMVETPENKNLPELLVPCLRRILLRLDTKERVNAAAKRGLGILKSFARALKVQVGELEFGLDIPIDAGVADSGDLEIDLPDLMEAIGYAARERDRAVAIIIDELQYVKEKEFSSLIMAMHRVSQKQLPVILIGAGLPQLVGLAGKSKSYAERLFDYPKVDALSLADASLAIAEPARREGVEFDGSAVLTIANVTRGYPYFLQEWAYHTWNVASASPIVCADVTNAREIAERSLDEGFFRVRFDRLTPRERDYLFAMAGLGAGPHRSGDIAGTLGVTVESVAPIRSSLIRKGMVYSPAHGDTAFTVPLFNEYLDRVMSAT